MKTKITIFVLLLSVGLMAPLAAQVKMGHANLELILNYMPETRAMNDTLRGIEKVLLEKVQVKQNYLQTKVAEYQEDEPTLDDAGKQARQQELQKLDQEVKQDAGEAQNRLAVLQQQMLQPITSKLEGAIKELAAEEGYTYIINAMSGGNSIVLYGPPEHELTEKLLTRLGIELPKETEATEETAGN